MKGLSINEAIETVKMSGLEVTLVASSENGTEIIRHKLEKGKLWGLRPEEGWNALEYLQITKGTLALLNSDGQPSLVLQVGDTISAQPVQEPVLFLAQEETEFLYITSQPVFHSYSDILKRVAQLAIQVEEKDGYTANHCRRISQWSMKIGHALNLPYQELLILNYASYLHDLGKVCIPDSILNKPGKLTSTEWEIIKQHCSFGREILLGTKIPIMEKVGLVVEQHHERFDGKGYPFGLKANEIDIKASIISVVDSFDAMTIDRVYQKARTVDEALEELTRFKGTMYHPLVVDAFLSIIEQEESVQ